MPAMTPRFTVGIGRAFGRKPCKEPVPFQEILPLKLKDSVSGKGEKTSGNQIWFKKKNFYVFYSLKKITDVACLQDMAVMLACFKKHDFNQALCSKEISSFQSCYSKFEVILSIFMQR